ncbi:MAG TPA: type II CAAX endopeptidase family protein, partial [Bacteroidia bacterium]|nr:type II CAAX endopeptidase family protein [Bacteroidia bacterium]
RDFDLFDLALVFFPAMMFLVTPVVEALLAESPDTSGAASDEQSTNVLGLLVSIGYFAFVGIMTYGLIAWVRNRPVVSLFGLRRLGVASIVAYSILGGAVSLFVCGWLVGEWTNQFLIGIFGELDVQEPVKMLQESDSAVHLVLSIVLACIAAPLVEELLFRGYMYNTLRSLTHPVFAAVVVAALFGVVHGNLPALLPLSAFSILLSCAYEWTKCLWVPVGMHAFFNAANIALMMMPGADQPQ